MGRDLKAGSIPELFTNLFNQEKALHWIKLS